MDEEHKPEEQQPEVGYLNLTADGDGFSVKSNIPNWQWVILQLAAAIKKDL